MRPLSKIEPIAFEVQLLRARLARMDQHLNSFGRVWGEYLESRPHSLDRISEAAGTVVVRLRRNVPLPVELSVILGELLYEARAALDNCL